MTYLVIFAFGFLSVFMMGFQSRNVAHGHYIWAAGTSFAIGIFQAQIWYLITRPENDMGHTLVYALSGAVGIVTSIYVHKKVVKPRV